MTKMVNGYEIKPYAYLVGASFEGADLGGADLYGANLKIASLEGANLEGANLKYANLEGANLYGANLEGANLKYANLKGANLRGSKGVTEYISASLQVLPDEGDVIGWKKCLDGILVKLLIKSDTPRSSATTRKCRAKEVVVLDVIGSNIGISRHDGKITYKVDKRVVCDTWCEDRWDECAGGIHFFITRKEAEGD